MQNLRINMDRLRRHILELSEIGRMEDQGIYRMAFTDADIEGRRWLIEKIEAAGLEAKQDGAANIFGRLNSNRDKSDNPFVMVGSHIDTVPGAGHLDGSLGVLAGLEALQRLGEENLETHYPLELVSFTDEEGRFGGLFGSEALVGNINPNRILNTADLDGIKLVEAMAAQGLDAREALRARRSPSSVRAYIELHIEQGPVLDRLNIPIGIVNDITGLFKWSIRLLGAADHAGTTPMPMRRDALQGLADFAHELQRVLDEYGSENSVATVGKATLTPGTANTVPGKVEFSLDVRDTSQEILNQLGDAFRRALSAIARRRQLMFEFDVLSEVEPCRCDGEIIATLQKTCRDLGYDYHDMHSGAAHDAQIMTRLTRVGLIFAPSKEGRSHSPSEWTHWEDIETAANLTLNTLYRLAHTA